MRCARSRFVAESTRTSTFSERAAPSGRSSRSCSTRRSLACSAGERSPISSRKMVPPSASDEHAGAIGARVGEGAALVAEQLALEQRVGDGGAVDRDEGALGARRVEVQRARHQLLAGARLAGDEHVRGRAGEAPHQREDVLHDRRASDDVLEAIRARDLAAEARHLGAQAALLERLLDRGREIVDLEGLGDVVVRAELERALGGLDRAERGHDDDVRRTALRLGGADLGEHVEPVHVGHLDVGDDEIDVALPDARDTGLTAGGDLDVIALFGERLRDEVAHRGVVLDHEEVRAAPLGSIHVLVDGSRSRRRAQPRLRRRPDRPGPTRRRRRRRPSA